MDEIKMLGHLVEFGENFPSDSELIDAANNNAREMVLRQLKDELYRAAEEAIASIDEFQYPPLRDRLLANILKDEHYYISPDLSYATVFNEDVAGSVGDLVTGQQAAWRSAGGTPRERLFGWKFGIYLPFKGYSYGGSNNKFEDYPSYQDVINIRLDVWGDKAPYWRFLEWGNAGGGEAYPTFEGRNFIAQTTAKINGILITAKEAAYSDIANAMEYAVEEQIRNADRGTTRVYIGRISFGRVGGKLVQVEAKVGRAGVWYQLVVGGRYSGKITPGGALPTGEVFGGF